MTPESLRQFLRLSRPVYLLFTTLLYAMGGGVVRYLGLPLDAMVFSIGLVWILLFQLGVHYLVDYFDPKLGSNHPGKSPFSIETGTLGAGKLPRPVALWASFVTMTLTASLTVILMRDANFSGTTLVVIILLITGALVYAMPPLRLRDSGYGELTVSFLVANLVPAFAFSLQTGTLHRLIAMSTFPLTTIHIAMILTYEFPDFASDIKRDNLTLLVRMGWRSGINLHNMLILTAYLLLGLAAYFGLPGPIVLPPFSTLPLAGLQIWLISRIATGARPNWMILQVTSLSLFVAMSYLLAFSFWTL